MRNIPKHAERSGTVDPKLIQVLPEEASKKKKMLSALKHKKKGVYFYCITDSKDGILEIVPVWAYQLEHREDAVLLGLAETYRHALDLIEVMIGRVYRDTGTFDVRGYYGG